MYSGSIKRTTDYKTTMRAIEATRQKFFSELSTRLNLMRVQAPLFIPAGTGIQDTLFMTESKIKFDHD